jgi:hypothetical protein
MNEGSRIKIPPGNSFECRHGAVEFYTEWIISIPMIQIFFIHEGIF